MNYKKYGAMGALCAMGALAPQKAEAMTYVVEEPVYATEYVVEETVPQQIVYETVPTTIVQQQPVVYETTPVVYPATTVVQQPVITSPVVYYDGYYDAIGRRWWYNNGWTYRCPPICRPPVGYWGHHSGFAPHIGHCGPRGGFRHIGGPRGGFAPRGGFHHGGGPRGFHHGSGPRGGRCR